MGHFHINWSTSGYDWERFKSQEDAHKAASLLVRPNETFTVEQFDGARPVCAKLKSLTGRPVR
jgi:hypothetical protein